MRVKDKVVMVTGASSGIGRATARAFATKGAAVVLTARREDALDAALRACQDGGNEAVAIAADVTDARAVEELARRAVERFGRIDVWVNCAAVTVSSGSPRCPWRTSAGCWRSTSWGMSTAPAPSSPTCGTKAAECW
ncbi:SDR family NAD(P)-dependent oxidoreductase [Nonomuraea sp. SYSU D8015]|uniref:SDR family NAD(P)-dependent oxidoreductase n=1 Tax=Nonomuraea sp. SYSU D8015 TaxID=2593644 RepID=UPI0021D32E68|nr:SDR family NAD(P)-dependent oxidoreductase [Nonomuraea sp. SYSU D8015]